MKPLLKVKTTVKIGGQGSPAIDAPTWELIAILPSSLMHAVWNPDKQMLVCQFNSVKENYVDYPVKSKTGNINWQERKAEQYYRITVTDTDAVQTLLETYVENYKGEDFVIKFEEPVPQEEPTSQTETVEEKESLVEN